VRELSAATVGARPIRPSLVLQFGGGNMLRAFVDVLIQQANDLGIMDAGIVVVGATHNRSSTISTLVAQDGYYHVLLDDVRNGVPVREFVFVDCINDVVHAREEFSRYRRAYLNPEVKLIISNTTETGIVWAPEDDIFAKPPHSFPAKIAGLLWDRYRSFDGDPQAGLHILCCELVQNNATKLRNYVIRHAKARRLPAEFVDWVENACYFHNTLVDRIVPGVPRSEIAAIWEELDYQDELVVKAERFGTWVITTGVPGSPDDEIRELLPLDKVGPEVAFVSDLRPLWDRKIRILNGLHTAMTPIALLAGYRHVQEALADRELARFLGALLAEEILPSIRDHDYSDIGDLDAFATDVVRRFANPRLPHELVRISLNSLAKWGERNLPVVKDAWAHGRGAHGTIISFAALAVLYSGQGVDATAARRSGFTGVDDEAMLALVRSMFPGPTATLPQLERWLRGIIDAAGYFEPAESADAARLATAAAPIAHAILRDGIRLTLRTLNLPPVTLPVPDQRAVAR